MLRLAGAAILMAFAAPAYAGDWYYVANATNLANISFIDRDSIREEAGVTRASMFSLLAAPDEDNTIAYRFELEVKCTERQSRLVSAVGYDVARAPGATEEILTDWASVGSETQGGAVANFICSKDKPGSANPGAGAQLPFDAGKTMLANLAKANGQ